MWTIPWNGFFTDSGIGPFLPPLLWLEAGCCWRSRVLHRLHITHNNMIMIQTRKANPTDIPAMAPVDMYLMMTILMQRLHLSYLMNNLILIRCCYYYCLMKHQSINCYWMTPVDDEDELLEMLSSPVLLLLELLLMIGTTGPLLLSLLYPLIQ